MATKKYDFHYTPDSGRLPGVVFEQQTEDAINDIGDLAVTAKSTADEALTTANDLGNRALSTAQNALNTAQDAQTKAEQAQKTADSATTSAGSAQATADEALATAKAATTTGANNGAAIATLQNTVNDHDTKINANITSINTINTSVENVSNSVTSLQTGINEMQKSLASSQSYTLPQRQGADGAYVDIAGADDATEYGRYYLKSTFEKVPAGLAYPVYLDVVPTSFANSAEDGKYILQRARDNTGKAFYRVGTGANDAEGVVHYTWSAWVSIADTFLKLAGGTVTGGTTFSKPLTVATPTADTHATTKKYVDDADAAGKAYTDSEITKVKASISAISGASAFTAKKEVAANGTVSLTDLAIPKNVTPKVGDLIIDTTGTGYLVTAVASDNVTIGSAAWTKGSGSSGTTEYIAGDGISITGNSIAVNKAVVATFDADGKMTFPNGSKMWIE